MSLSAKTQIYFWGAAFVLFFAFVWLFSDVLTPFVLGIAIAYLLNPLTTWFSKIGLPRTASSLLILILFLLFVVLIVALAGPPAYRQMSALVQNIPGYVDALIEWLTPYIAMLQERLGDGYAEEVKAFLQSNVGKAAQITGALVGGIASGGQAVAGFMTTLVLTPLVAFFMMQKWPDIVSWVENLYPRQHEKMIRDLVKQIDAKLSGFVRGQLSVAFILGAVYAIALSIAGLNYGFLIGVSAGLLSIIPMVGSTLGLLVSLVVAWFQTGELSYVGIIAAIFIVGQIVEGNFLTPKLVGDSVGLHPLWVLFALMAGGSLFGILGMLLAVPVAAVIGVLLSFGILTYKASPLYKKSAPKAKEGKDA